MAARSERPSGLRIIIAYKYIKGGATLVLAILVWIVALGGSGAALAEMVSRHLHHLAHPWAYRLGDAIVRALSGHYLMIAATVLSADGTFTLLEGWALHHGAWWGPWLVVASTSLLLPPEIVALARHASAVRGAVLVINGIIVVYLARHARRHAKNEGAR
ncbi:DUF2127 domain-containing protein [Pendulispora albinea]|uniref:DUF2127 domain-containing protein n=1 Tax=Pendulispora albinea TaxID=2741071 RepID=A0ABZ2M4M8_9BACT